MAIDYQALFGGDDYDPCEALKQLRPAYMQLKMNGQAQKVRFRDRELWYHKPDLSAMGALIQELESECRAKNGLPPRRFAIKAGYGRR